MAIGYRCLIFIIISFAGYLPKAQEKLFCISVDDLPTVSYGLGNEVFNRQLTSKLLESFAAYDVKAIGFVNEDKLYREGQLDSSQLSLLANWLEAGMELGNHTYDHVNFHRVPFDRYTSSIMKGETHTRPLMRKYGDSLKYFRHPYLRMGKSATHADSLSLFLKKIGYVISPVTVDNEDYLFALAYSRAYKKGDTALMTRIGKDYTDYMVKKVQYYESQSINLFGRPIAQTLLVHASLLNAHYMKKLLHRIQNLGYQFISQTQVLQDTAYDSKVEVYGDWGISWIDRWALSQGKPGSFFKGDIPTPQYIKDLSK
jgi:peptidoglycan/xylan/chitin deacetylase (PgdA/CDA1 family)